MPAQVRRPMVAGNWKMNGSKALVSAMTQSLSEVSLDNVDVVICPPMPLLACVEPNKFYLGAQNVSQYDAGAYTGESSTSILSELDVRYVIVGHSERRELFAEDDQVVVQKVQAVLNAGLTPIVCFGESLKVREEGNYLEFLYAQVDAVLNGIGSKIKDCVLAYEPIWAIGTGNTASPEQAQQVHAKVREHIAQEYTDIAAGLTILYGGSVNAANAAELFSQQDVDGGLVGGASLKTDDFIAICQAANNLD